MMTAERDSIVASLRIWLRGEGVAFFREMQEKHGTVSPVFMEGFGIVGGDCGSLTIGRVPHAVHFHEGMQVRNFLRDLPETNGWDCGDFDDRWQELVELAIVDP